MKTIDHACGGFGLPDFDTNDDISGYAVAYAKYDCYVDNFGFYTMNGSSLIVRSTIVILPLNASRQSRS